MDFLSFVLGLHTFCTPSVQSLHECGPNVAHTPRHGEILYNPLNEARSIVGARSASDLWRFVELEPDTVNTRPPTEWFPARIPGVPRPGPIALPSILFESKLDNPAESVATALECHRYIVLLDRVLPPEPTANASHPFDLVVSTTVAGCASAC